jgi:hypothetical protein
MCEHWVVHGGIADRRNGDCRYRPQHAVFLLQLCRQNSSAFCTCNLHSLQCPPPPMKFWARSLAGHIRHFQMKGGLTKSIHYWHGAMKRSEGLKIHMHVSEEHRGSWLK